MMKTIVSIANGAGDRILEVYEVAKLAVDVQYKSDDSPLTLADQRAHQLIAEELGRAFPEIPVLSEEGAAIDYTIRSGWDRYWLVDPLDGTKEFINRNGEFTVNIALVEQRRAVMGVVHAPVLKKTYCGEIGVGATMIDHKEQVEKTLQVNNKGANRIAVRSKSHPSPEEESVLEKYDVTDTISVGSSLKFCLLAEGKADVYYRHGPTMEWDVGAGQAVAEAAGGKVFAGTGPEPFLLTKEELLNGSFLCLGCAYQDLG